MNALNPMARKFARSYTDLWSPEYVGSYGREIKGVTQGLAIL
jgi:hypothetical protein